MAGVRRALPFTILRPPPVPDVFVTGLALGLIVFLFIKNQNTYIIFLYFCMDSLKVATKDRSKIMIGFFYFKLGSLNRALISYSHNLESIHAGMLKQGLYSIMRTFLS